ncbi:hypothetical protein AVEN_121851-1 [Araneus ventricosus]|uniref:Uncharacterized protein n=1 Tax=Araneus ventricosus TaxID=182803 RepID=A0A4Y2JJT4_ARAVE|nr:hypothetical protein AVEN_121851-1 [Araneus ventricosus]
MLPGQETFLVLEQMVVAGSKIRTKGGMVKQLPDPPEPLQHSLHARRRIRTSIVKQRSASTTDPMVLIPSVPAYETVRGQTPFPQCR